MMTQTQAGWYADPKGSYLYRYWDGAQWTDQVSNGAGHTGTDPAQLSAATVTTPPAPGTAAPSATPPPQPTINVTQSRRSSPWTIIAVLLAAAALVIVIVVVANSGDDSSSPDIEAPTTTEAPAPSE